MINPVHDGEVFPILGISRNEVAQERPYIPGDVGFPPGSSQTRALRDTINGGAVNIVSTQIEAAQSAAKSEKRYWNSIVPANKTQATGIKYDSGKPRMDLLDSPWLEEVAQVLTFGAQKYAANNWRGGIAYSRLIASAYRHLGAISRGEDIDEESGLPHVAHLSCCLMFLSSMMRTKPELDDRYKAA